VVVDVEHGEVVDLRLDGTPVATGEAPGGVAVELSVAGSVSEHAKWYVLEKMSTSSLVSELRCCSPELSCYST
jgi:hypothetical protein